MEEETPDSIEQPTATEKSEHEFSEKAEEERINDPKEIIKELKLRIEESNKA